MGTLPDFDPTAYGGEVLETKTLAELARAYDQVEESLGQLEVRNRVARAKVERSRINPLPLEMRELYNSTRADVSAARETARKVRLSFARRLRDEVGSLGYLVGTAVYRAAVDCQGIERIELANPPSPTPEA